MEKRNIKNKIQEDYEKGKVVEVRFESLMTEKCISTERSSREVDRLEGWDLKVTNIPDEEYNFLLNKRIDVKGIKGIGYNWLELIAYESDNTRKLGWLLRGKADYLAFEREQDFLIVKKSKLREFVYAKIPVLQELEDNAKLTKCTQEKFERFFCNNICAGWGLFTIIDNYKRKDEALYEKLYTRCDYDHPPDLLFKIMDNDIVEMSELIINK